jgi:hypothetical protein
VWICWFIHEWWTYVFKLIFFILILLVTAYFGLCCVSNYNSHCSKTESSPAYDRTLCVCTSFGILVLQWKSTVQTKAHSTREKQNYNLLLWKMYLNTNKIIKYNRNHNLNTNISKFFFRLSPLFCGRETRQDIPRREAAKSASLMRVSASLCIKW